MGRWPIKRYVCSGTTRITADFLRKHNKHGVPVPLIMIQGIIVSIWGAVLTFGGGGNNLSFLVAISLTVVIYLIGYLLFFLGYFVLLLRKRSSSYL